MLSVMDGGEVVEQSGNIAPTAAPTELRRHGRDRRTWLTLVVAVLGVAMVGLDGTAVTVAVPYISASVDATLGQLELIANAYFLALAIGLLPAAQLCDRIGRRTVFVIGVAGFGLASLGAALSGSVWALIAFRVLQGFAGALVQPAALAVLRRAFRSSKLGLPFGIWGGINAIAIGIGPMLAGPLVHGFGWPAVFWLNVPAALVASVLTFIVVEECAEPERVSPAAILRMLKTKVLSVGAVLVGVSSFAVFGLLFLLTLYLQNLRGLDPLAAGAWLLAPAGVVMVSAPVGGVLAHQLGSRWPVFLGLMLTAAGLGTLVLLEPGAGFTAVLYPAALVGLGAGLCGTASTKAMLASSPETLIGMASAVQQAACQIGAVLGITTVGSVISLQVAHSMPGRLEQAELPPGAEATVRSGADAIAQGNVPPGFAESTVGDPLAKAVRALSQLTFTDAMGMTFLATAAVSAVCAVLALLLPSRSVSLGAEKIDSITE